MEASSSQTACRSAAQSLWDRPWRRRSYVISSLSKRVTMAGESRCPMERCWRLWTQKHPPLRLSGLVSGLGGWMEQQQLKAIWIG